MNTCRNIPIIRIALFGVSLLISRIFKLLDNLKSVASTDGLLKLAFQMVKYVGLGIYSLTF